jgi:hypothetical protein
MVPLLFFSIAQAAVFLFIKTHPSFTDSKWMFLLFESIIVFITVFLYLCLRKSRPTSRQKSPHFSQQAGVQVAVEQSKKEDVEEIAALKMSLQQAMQEKEEVLQRIANLLSENEQIAQKLLHEEERVHDMHMSAMKQVPFIQRISNEIEKVAEYLDEIKRQHALEIRVLLGKEEKKKKEDKIAATPQVFRLPSSPLVSALHLLSRIHAGLSLQEGAHWPASEHSLLVRRKIFDVASAYPTTPFALISFKTPADSFLSPKIPAEMSLQRLHDLLSSHMTEIEPLPPFSPFFVEEERISLVIFHILDDLFLCL